MALNNPLIDDYSLKGAKGLLVNITGGKDITLFEVDQAVNKIRAEVDPEAELIFGAIKDESLNGKMRVSIVATALDGQVASTNGVVNMVNRIQNRNSGYTDGLFSASRTTVPNNSYNASVGATALKLEDQFEPIVEPQQSIDSEQQTVRNETSLNLSETNEEFFSENTGQNATEENMFEVDSIEQVAPDNETPLTLEEEYTPKLFSEETSLDENNITTSTEEQKLFDQDKNQEDDFEIPAFLRRQKF
jgi:cell division protein FtsZ